ncbi:MAG: hypothetical protein AB2693_20600, partial [Candidatus Thiodiazotropha sp.]
VCMKLTPKTSGTGPKFNLFRDSKWLLRDKVETLIEHFMKGFNNSEHNIGLFFKADTEGYVEYFVLYIELSFEFTNDVDEFFEDLIGLTKSDVTFGMYVSLQKWQDMSS